MNSPIAALLVVSALFATAWVRDQPAHHPDRQVAMRAFIEPEVLAEARKSRRKAENIADSARVQQVETGDKIADLPCLSDSSVAEAENAMTPRADAIATPAPLAKALAVYGNAVRGVNRTIAGCYNKLVETRWTPAAELIALAD